MATDKNAIGPGPVFGSQTDRFSGPHHEIPPPGAYDLDHAFQAIKTKGRVETTGGLHSKSKRELFKGNHFNLVKEKIPGPGEYDPKADIHKPKTAIEPFLSKGERFSDPDNWVPGPGFYENPKSSLIKKTFNVSLIEWSPQIST